MQAVKIQKMNKQRRSLNNSLGKTLTRVRHNQHHQSFFVVPNQFDQNSAKQAKEGNFTAARNNDSTPKVSDFRIIPQKCQTLGDSISKIIKSRKNCKRIGLNIQDSIVQKSLALNRLYRNMHHFWMCVDQLKWLLTEGNSLIEDYVCKTTLISPDSLHTKDMSNISKQFKSLALRFQQIQKGRLESIQNYLMIDKMQKVLNTNQFVVSQQPHTKLPCFSKNISLVTQSQQLRQKPQSRNQSVLGLKKIVTSSIKQNINSLNQTSEFDNIRVEKHPKIKCNGQMRQLKEVGISATTIEKQQAQLQTAKAQFYNNLRALNTKNQQLLVKIQLLQEELTIQQAKTSHYRVVSYKSIEQLSDILSNLIKNPNQQYKDFQLLRMTQCVALWEKMMQDQQIENKYKQLYESPQKIQTQRSQKLNQIIQLQYQINKLLGQKNCLQNQDSLSKNNKIERKTDAEDIYRMIVTQAFTLEELCKI